MRFLVVSHVFLASVEIMNLKKGLTICGIVKFVEKVDVIVDQDLFSLAPFQQKDNILAF